ncbi:hypothetical protein EZV62_016795 [Acer yangbiense]|uniref:Non-specific lipid-transfer protein n=1 Tax=Acer yangbiense TaxID=1000413 RepID=A0A5C7HRP5_9ROSI|nr:hypothetical protein EZV62_016795 [Acer yangbiense]
MAADLKLVYCALVACMLVVAAPIADTAVSCGLVVISVTPCIGYLRSTEPLTEPCCNGIKALNRAAVTTVDRQQTCRCLKKAATTTLHLPPASPPCAVSTFLSISAPPPIAIRSSDEKCKQWSFWAGKYGVAVSN